jgi:hypothetical protein
MKLTSVILEQLDLPGVNEANVRAIYGGRRPSLLKR